MQISDFTVEKVVLSGSDDQAVDGGSSVAEAMADGVVEGTQGHVAGGSGGGVPEISEREAIVVFIVFA